MRNPESRYSGVAYRLKKRPRGDPFCGSPPRMVDAGSERIPSRLCPRVPRRPPDDRGQSPALTPRLWPAGIVKASPTCTQPSPGSGAAAWDTQTTTRRSTRVLRWNEKPHPPQGSRPTLFPQGRWRRSRRAQGELRLGLQGRPPRAPAPPTQLRTALLTAAIFLDQFLEFLFLILRAGAPGFGSARDQWCAWAVIATAASRLWGGPSFQWKQRREAISRQESVSERKDTQSRTLCISEFGRPYRQV